MTHTKSGSILLPESYRWRRRVTPKKSSGTATFLAATRTGWGTLGNIGVWNESPLWPEGGNRFVKLDMRVNSDEKRVWNNADFGFVRLEPAPSHSISRPIGPISPDSTFSRVKIGSTVIDIIDLGGVSPGRTPVTQKSYDISALSATWSNSVEFKVMTDFSTPRLRGDRQRQHPNSAQSRSLTNIWSFPAADFSAATR